MDGQPHNPPDEIKRLQRCFNDLVSVLALPAIWTGDSSQIVRTLLDALLRMLRLDFVYARLNDPVGEAPVEMVRFDPPQKLTGRPEEIGARLHHWLGDDPRKWPPLVRDTIGDSEISIVPLRLGLHGDVGVLIAASLRADFPEQAERLVLSVAANQAAIGLQEARRLCEQKRVAKELNQRVAQRTAELSAANEEREKEAAERKRAEEALRTGEINLRRIVDSVAGLVCTLSATGQVELLNRQVLEYFGKTPEELKTWALTDAAHPDDLPRVLAAFTYSITSGDPYDIEHRCRRADGVYRWFQIRALPVRDTDGRITGWYVLLIDIDDRKRAEEQLRRNHAFLTEAQHLSSTGSFSWRVATDEITWSNELYRIFEFESGTPVTLERIGTRVHPEDLALLQDMVDHARGDGDDFEYEHRLLMPNGSVKYLHLVGHGTRDPEGRLEYIGASQDVTQRRMSEEALGKARSELARVARVTSLGALTASIAHEVNQPLSGIITNASTCLRMLAADPPNVDGARETARRTIRDGHRASDVITRLRALFSKKSGTIESVDLNEATREVITLSLSELQRNQVVLRVEFADDLPPVTGDRVQLQQVVLNLLVNASDAMSGIDDRPRQLLIRTERDEGDAVCVSVQDTGVGIEPQSADKLFDAFFTTKSGGMGIGLSVSRSIIDSHRGRLWAAPNDGPGATFSFSIPRGPEGVTGPHSRGVMPTHASKVPHTIGGL